MHRASCCRYTIDHRSDRKDDSGFVVDPHGGDDAVPLGEYFIESIHINRPLGGDVEDHSPELSRAFRLLRSVVNCVVLHRGNNEGRDLAFVGQSPCGSQYGQIVRLRASPRKEDLCGGGPEGLRSGRPGVREGFSGLAAPTVRAGRIPKRLRQKWEHRLPDLCPNGCGRRVVEIYRIHHLWLGQSELLGKRRHLS